MGLFGDYQRLRRTSKEAAAAQGRPTTAIGRLANLGNDMQAAANQAEWVAAQSAGPVDELVGGIAGTATLYGHRATGAMAGFEPISELDLEVALPGHDVYRVTASVRIPHQHLVRVTVGRQLRVRVDPQDAARLAIDWD